MANASCGTNKTFKYIGQDDVTLRIFLAIFRKTLPRSQRVDFGYILQPIENKYDEEKYGNNDNLKMQCQQLLCRQKYQHKIPRQGISIFIESQCCKVYQDSMYICL